MKTLCQIIATFFGLGYFPLAPGTVASLVIVLLYRFFLHKLSWPLYLLIFLLLFFLGTFASSKYSSRLKEKDPRKVVIDEACGQLFVFFMVPESWAVLLIGFFLFRIFDIIKPFPIRKVENLPTGWGIMADDIMAAIYAGLFLHLYLLLK